MKNITKDRQGYGALGWTAVILGIGVLVVLMPMIIGWALAYLIHTVTGEPEITDFWIRWTMGIAVVILAFVFKPNYYFKMANGVRGGGRDYWFNDNE